MSFEVDFRFLDWCRQWFRSMMAVNCMDCGNLSGPSEKIWVVKSLRNISDLFCVGKLKLKMTKAS